LPPLPGLSPFARLGLEASVSVDDATVERAWLSRSRQVHPDRFQQRPPAERRAAAEQTAALNDAYRALKTAFGRAVVVVGLEGGREPKLPQVQLVAFMEAREEAEASSDAKAAVAARAAAQFTAGLAALTTSLAALPTETEARRRAVTQAGLRLAELRTWGRLAQDLGGPKLLPGER